MSIAYHNTVPLVIKNSRSTFLRGAFYHAPHTSTLHEKGAHANEIDRRKGSLNMEHGRLQLRQTKRVPSAFINESIGVVTLPPGSWSIIEMYETRLKRGPNARRVKEVGKRRPKRYRAITPS